MQGGAVLMQCELAGANVAEGAGGEVGKLGLPGFDQRQLELVKSFLILAGAEDFGDFVQACGYCCAARGKCLLRLRIAFSDLWSGSRHRSDQREHEQATSQDFNCFQREPGSSQRSK